jgi:hypothetical protein
MMAKNRLESEGVTAQVTEEVTGDLFQLASPLGVRLLVAEDDLERAGAILDAHEKIVPAPAGVPEEGISTTRSCPMCGKPFGIEYECCPTCGPPQPEVAPSADDETAVTTEEEFARVEAGELAFRAFRAAVVSMIIFWLFGMFNVCLGAVFGLPVFIYSAWLLCRVSAFSGELSRPALFHFIGAMVMLGICTVSALAYFAIFWR